MTWYLMCAGLYMLYQDLLGKELYIKTINAWWVSAWITVPIVFVLCTISIVLYRREN